MTGPPDGPRDRVEASPARVGREGDRGDLGGIRLGLFGGSFDPIHRGHVRPVQEARRRFGLERVIYLPTANPPHKQDPESAPVASPAARYAMVEMALLEEKGLYVSDLELRPDGPSYTVDTLEHFARREPSADLVLILGSDSLAQLPTWRRWRDLLELARLVVLTRPGNEIAGLRAELAPELREGLDGGAIDVIEDGLVDVSSTVIRDRLAAGERSEAWMEKWMAPLVVDYIEKYDLYR